MDPFSLAAGVVGLTQALTELIKLASDLKDSIEKISRNRRKARQLSSDVLQTIVNIEAFYSRHKNVLDDSQGLHEFVADLKMSLNTILQSSKILVVEPETGAIRRGKAAFRAWLKRDQLEEDIIELNSQTQRCQIKFMTLATLKMNITTHEILATTTRIETAMSSKVQQRLVVRRMSNETTSDVDMSFGTSTVVGVERIHETFIGETPFSLTDTGVRPLSKEYITEEFLHLQADNLNQLVSDILHRTTSNVANLPLRSNMAGTITQLSTPLYLQTTYESLQQHTILRTIQLTEVLRNPSSSPRTLFALLGHTTALVQLHGFYSRLNMPREQLVISSMTAALVRSAYSASPSTQRLAFALALERWASDLLYRPGEEVQATTVIVEAIAHFRHELVFDPGPASKVNLANCLATSSRISRWTRDVDGALLELREALRLVEDLLPRPRNEAPTVKSHRTTHDPRTGESILYVVDTPERTSLAYAYICAEFECHFERKSWAEAYKYASAARHMFQAIHTMRPDSYTPTFAHLSRRLAADWANSFHSVNDRITLFADAIYHLSLVPTRSRLRISESNDFAQYSCFTRQSICFRDIGKLPDAIEAQNKGVFHLQRYLHSNPLDVEDQTTLDATNGSELVSCLLQEALLLHHLRARGCSLLKWYGDDGSHSSPRLLSVRQGSQSLLERLKTVVRSVSRVQGFEEFTLGGISFITYSLLQAYDLAYPGGKRLLASLTGKKERGSTSPGGSTNIRTVSRKHCQTVYVVLLACTWWKGDPRSVDLTMDITSEAKAIWQPPMSHHEWNTFNSLFQFRPKQLEIHDRLDEALVEWKACVDFYTSYSPPDGYEINDIYLTLISGLSRNFLFHGQWGAALEQTRVGVDQIVGNASKFGRCDPRVMAEIDKWHGVRRALVFIDHSLLLTDLGDFGRAGTVIDEGLPLFVDSGTEFADSDQRIARFVLACRKSAILMRQGDDKKAVSTAKAALEVDEPPPLPFAPVFSDTLGEAYTTVWLDLSNVFADAGQSIQAIKFAKRGLEALEETTNLQANVHLHSALLRTRNELGLALAVAQLMECELDDALSILKDICELSQEQAKLRQSMYPAYAVALRLLAWCHCSMGNNGEGRKVQKRLSVTLELLSLEDEDAETLSVVKKRLEVEQRRRSTRQIRDRLGIVDD